MKNTISNYQANEIRFQQRDKETVIVVQTTNQ